MYTSSFYEECVYIPEHPCVWLRIDILCVNVYLLLVDS